MRPPNRRPFTSIGARESATGTSRANSGGAVSTPFSTAPHPTAKVTDWRETRPEGWSVCDERRAQSRAPPAATLPSNRASSTACGRAGAMREPAGRLVGGDPLTGAARRLHDGAVVAVKGLGGYHLAARADHEGAVA